MPNIRPCFVYLENMCDERQREAVCGFLERCQEQGFNEEHGIPTGGYFRQRLKERARERAHKVPIVGTVKS